MPEEKIQPQRTYWCFISYRHLDNREEGRQWATWLHQAIETYSVPEDLVGTVTERGDTIPSHIFPVFRDEEELPVDSELELPIFRALEASKFLVVICSPNAVASRYVESEIRYFKQIGRANRVLAVMVAGEPNASIDTGKQAAGFSAADECFPLSIRHDVSPEGELLADVAEPIAADFRLGREQGWTSPEGYRAALQREGMLSPREIDSKVTEYAQRGELMKLKIIAGILGVPLGTLTQRDKAHQLRLAQNRARVLRRWLAAVGALAAIALVLGVVARLKQREAEFQRRQTTQAHLRLLTDSAAVRLRERDVRAAQGMVLEVLTHPEAAQPPAPERVALFQEARALDFQALGLAGHKGPVRGAVFSADGRQIVTVGDDRTARVWDAQTGAAGFVLRGTDEPLRAVAMTAGGNAAAISASGHLRAWELRGGKEINQLGPLAAGVNAIAFSPDGSILAVASGTAVVRLWSSDPNQRMRELAGHGGAVRSVAFSADGSRLLTASEDRTARLWDVATGKQLRTFAEHSDVVLGACFSPDGKRLVTVSQDKTGRLWETETGAALKQFYGHLGAVHGVAFTPDGRFVVTASADRTARVWDARTAVQCRVLAGHWDEVWSVACAPDGRRVVTASADGTARVWHVFAPGQRLEWQAHEDLVTWVGFSPEGTRLLTTSGDRSGHLWAAASGQSLGALRGHGGLINAGAWSADGKLIATASYDATVKLWDAADRHLLDTWEEHKALVSEAAFSPDARRVATAGYDKVVRVRPLGGGEAPPLILAGHEGVLRSVAFSPDGRTLVSASDDRTARLWNAVDGKLLARLEGHRDAVRSAAFSADGARVVTASNDLTARLWEAATGKEVLTFTGHAGVLRSAALSPDGRFVLTSAYDRTARVWDARSGQQLEVLPVRGDGVRAAAWAPDGGRVATGSLDGTVAIWELRPPAELAVQIQWLAAASFDTFDPAERERLGLRLAGPRESGAAERAVALGREARQVEQREDPNESGPNRRARLLRAFALYVAACRAAEAAGEPEDGWRESRFRRASLARLLAGEGFMNEVVRELK